METVEAMESIWPPSSEDGAILEAALRFLDASDAGCSSPPTTTSPDTKGTKDGSTRTNRRPKKQIDALREEVEGLERTIAGIQARQDAKGAVSDMLGAMVARGLTQRLKAEAENQRLRELIQEQNDLRHRLKRVILDREASVKRTLGWTERIRHTSACYQHLLPSDSAALESVTSDLLPMLLHTPSVLAHPHLQSDGRCAMFDKIPGIDRPALHVADSRVVPFDPKTTSAAVWANLLSQLGGQYEAWQPSSGVLRSLHDKAFVEVPGFRGTVRVIMALRRFEETDRVVYVRSSIFTYLDVDGRTGDIAFPGLTVRHSLWTIVQRSEFPELSRVRTLGISIPEFVATTQAQAAALDRFLTRHCLQFTEFAHEDVDNRLLTGKGMSVYTTLATWEECT